MKNLRSEHKVLIGIIAFLIIIIILSNIINGLINYKLIKEVDKVIKIIEKEEIDFIGTIAYNINNEKSADAKNLTVDIKSSGIVYYDDKGNITVVLEHKNKCGIKLPETDTTHIMNEKCPDYRFLQGAKLKLDIKSDLVEYNEEFYYKGKFAQNYIVYNNEYWRIVGFTTQGIKIVNDYPMGMMEYSINGNSYENDITDQYLNNEYGIILPSIEKATWNIGASIGQDKEEIEKDEKQTTYSTKVGTLTLSDYLKSIDGDCKIKEKKITCTNDTYIQSKNGIWLMTPYTKDSTKAWATDKDNVIYVENTSELKDIRPVVILDKKYKIINGAGSKENPYILTITN